MHQMQYGAPPQGYGISGPPVYGQPYGRGGYPPQVPQYGAQPPQGMDRRGKVTTIAVGGAVAWCRGMEDDGNGGYVGKTCADWAV